MLAAISFQRKILNSKKKITKLKIVIFIFSRIVIHAALPSTYYYTFFFFREKWKECR